MQHRTGELSMVSPGSDSTQLDLQPNSPKLQYICAMHQPQDYFWQTAQLLGAAPAAMKQGLGMISSSPYLEAFFPG